MSSQEIAAQVLKEIIFEKMTEKKIDDINNIPEDIVNDIDLCEFYEKIYFRMLEEQKEEN